MLKQYKVALLYQRQYQNRCFSSEFKKFFGFEDHLEMTKFKNDTDLDFETKKMSKIAILVTSFRK